LASAFGYGTPAYLRYNEAATLDPSPLLAEAAARANGVRPGGAPLRHDMKVQETREHFSENRSRAITLLQQAIHTLEEEIAKSQPNVEKSEPTGRASIIATQAPAKAASPAKTERPAPAPRRWARISFEGVCRRLGRWLKRRR
jgi:hypothetical protein